MNVPFMDLKLQYAASKMKFFRRWRTFWSQHSLCSEAKLLPSKKSSRHSAAAQHGVAVNTGTSALHLALLAAGVGPGDEVITVPCTFVATVAAIRYTGATPVFVDVDPMTYTMDVNKIEAAITSKTKVVLPVHLYGNPADMDPILANRAPPQPTCHRGLRSGARRRVSRPPVRIDWRYGLF